MTDMQGIWFAAYLVALLRGDGTEEAEVIANNSVRAFQKSAPK